MEPEAQEVPKDDTPEIIPGVRRSHRVRTQTKQSYVPSMSGTKYETIMAQLEQHGTFHPDSHMFFNQALEEKPTIVSVVMTQLLEIASKATPSKSESPPNRCRRLPKKGKRRKGLKGLALTKLPLKKGLKEWGKKGTKGMYSEMKQLHFRDTFRPGNMKDLTEKERKEMLESHIFLKQNRYGNVKGRHVAGGNK